MEFWAIFLGAFLAATFGLAGFLIQEQRRQKTEKRKIARALFSEMLNSLNFLAAGHDVAVEVSEGSGSKPISELTKCYPVERNIFKTSGPHIGMLSDKAMFAALDFEHQLQALERDIKCEVGDFAPGYRADPQMAKNCAGYISDTIKESIQFVECMAREVYGKSIPETEDSQLRYLKSEFGH